MDSAFKDIPFSSYLKPQIHTQRPQENGFAEDAELSVFDAHKYFSEINNQKDTKAQKQHELLDDVVSGARPSSVSSVDGYVKNFRTRSIYRMPTASSEASWNSRTGLLPNPPTKISTRNLPADHRNRKKTSAVKKWFLGRKCCCSGEKAVQVKETIITNSEERGTEVIVSNTTKDSKSKDLHTNGDQSNKEVVPVMGFGPTEAAPRKQRISASGRPFLDGSISFTFPVLNPSAEQHNKPPLIGALARSISNLNKHSKHEIPSVSGEESMNVCANRGGDFTRRGVFTDDDAGSDASSDLFEIENFSTETTSYPINLVEYERMDVVEAAAAECYAPSEVSIDWSVATAEVGDRASVGNFSTVYGPGIRLEELGGGEKRKGSNGLMLMGCRQEKAVSVAAQPVKFLASDGGRPARGERAPVGNCRSVRRTVAFAA